LGIKGESGFGRSFDRTRIDLDGTRMDKSGTQD